ncbi:hypothetical protein F2P56_021113 [Juglans regia]|uniref:CASP-like protein n=2 Tax=Juglans regia TaxID=51240 RepID=A0A2I4FTB6_JUGRE|nr:CASP-like protein 1F2 [Juglans regia]KAF5456969.1 hypothetical protein F2P56_021113 [Juglans regia]
MASPMTKERSSFMLQTKSSGMSSPSQRRCSVAQLILRVLAVAFTAAAISVTVTSGQSVVILGFTFKARYSYSSAMRFLLGVDAVVCAFSALSLIFVYLLLNRSGSHLTNYFYLFLHDMVMTVLMISGCAAATAVGYIGRYGEERIGWGAVCGRIGKFCNRNLVSLVLSYLTFLAYLALAIISASKLMSRATE